VFYPRGIWETLSTFAGLAWYALKLERLRRRIQRDPQGALYRDAAISPPETSDHPLPVNAVA
jgi:hypothetical protein